MTPSLAGPAEVKGFYQKIRDLLQPILIIFFLVAPWIQIQNQPMLLFDVVHRHFVFFGSTFYAHEAPLLFYLLILLILAIFFVTAIFGRLWCGWVCPQTVFLNAVFNRVEKWMLGPYAKRMAFYKQEDSFVKKMKILLVYAVFFVLCWVLSHSFAAYFLGAATITNFVMDGPGSHMLAFVVCSIMTIVLFFNFAFFREKLCVYVCPYGRFQNALIDRNSLVVFYDEIRGEPRAKASSVSPSAFDKGDCVDCRRCVNVCPAKIDIRAGFQLECIACGQCIDACNDVMKKLKRPEKLIRYETGNQKPITFKRFRLALYAALMVLFAGGFAYSLYQRADVDFQFNRPAHLPFSAREQDGQKILQNQIHLHIKNQTQKKYELQLSLSEKNQARGYRLLSPALHLELEPGQDIKTTAFIEIPVSQYQADFAEIEMLLQNDKIQLRRVFQFIRQD